MTYEELAKKRLDTDWGYAQPEDYGYDFRAWVSPYTKTCYQYGGLLLVLQDWASHDFLAGGVDATVQELGRDPSVQTNIRLGRLVEEFLGLQLEDCYVTNLFPFIKPGGMSSAIPRNHLLRAGKMFLSKEVLLVEPTLTLALGSQVSLVMKELGLSHLALPHPAARISKVQMENAWRELCRC